MSILVARELVVALPTAEASVPIFTVRPDHDEFRLFLNDRIPTAALGVSL